MTARLMLGIPHTITFLRDCARLSTANWSDSLERPSCGGCTTSLFDPRTSIMRSLILSFESCRIALRTVSAVRFSCKSWMHFPSRRTVTKHPCREKTCLMLRATSPSMVRSMRPLTMRADVSSRSFERGTSTTGVEIILEALMISLIRGTPSVTFMDAIPAKWNVLSVICVPGSPIDCAPIAPTALPGSATARRYLQRHSSRRCLSCPAEM
mmetsp:Transcript_38256/g.90450  ORF Transcript_38256/g.90450 Transcript_38256/m.90450 type:complete len:211 (+) Transcript_38256:668-1300(+)